MSVTVKDLSEMFGKDVFTNKGIYCGKTADIDINLNKFRVHSLVIEAAKGSFLESMVGGKKGVIIPYQMVETIGDVIIIKHIQTPQMPEPEEPKKESPMGMFG